ncbi:Lrp/AsnC family transcriptional regulator [Tsukamurella sp. 8F]|uniref:Lrp/AsnC family transcriptional regulator n=1 Tax=unclassified Tsukamurella TaxID=2633480 RepID=UPI0023B984F8|nr:MULTISPECIES: Lrp/AsnC family transcriptional regulator [unclassified Tsukamurella]MDF0529078.1 Lrp/AsnC family transcriptional regulator [Tsukamurella sp. 8J]MDF0587452.1 Lrp/AsnC family transcriptional regulator [Tsukamurella sp. 8F]
MDEIDERLVELLAADGRAGHRHIAAVTGLSRSTVAARVQRLIDSGDVAVHGVVHPSVLGRGSLAYVRFVVSGPAAAVAETVAGRVGITFVSLTTGPYGVTAELRVASPAQVDAAVSELRALPGVARVDTLVYLEVVRDVIGPVGRPPAPVDAIDLHLLELLERDGRASFVRLAAAVGLSPTAVRRRVLTMIDERVVRVGAVVRRGGGQRAHTVGVGLCVRGDSARAARDVDAVPGVTFVGRTLGTYDLLVTVHGASAGAILGVLDALRGLPDVTAVDSWSHLRVVKEGYASLGAAQ